jgi:hypothetical protein
VVERRFCWGFCDFHTFFAWFLVVRLWWVGGGIVVFVCAIFGVKNFPRFWDLFLGAVAVGTAPGGFVPE